MKTPIFITYPWAFLTPGGGEMQLMKYYEYLNKAGINSYLFDFWKPKLNSKENIIHFFSCMGGSSHSCRFFKANKFPLVVTSSLWITKENQINYGIAEIKDQLEMADIVLTNSDMESENLSEILKISNSKIRYVYNGFDDNLLKLRNKYNNSKRSTLKQISCIANIEERKQQLKLIKSINLKKNLHLNLIGDIREKDYYEKIKSLDSPNVTYHGKLNHLSEKMINLLMNTDLFVLPSTLETPGIAALEAAAIGVPILITNEGSTKEYFNDEVNYVNPNCDEETLFEMIKKSIIEKKQVSEKLISRYKWSNTVKKLLDIYKEI